MPLGKHHSFKLFWPIVGGLFNNKDYTSPRVVTADLETIWTKVIQDDLGIERVKFRVRMDTFMMDASSRK